MINFDDATKENIKEHNPNQLQIPVHPQRILIIGGFGFGKSASSYDLINQQSVMDKIYLAKYEVKYQFLVHKRKYSFKGF